MRLIRESWVDSKIYMVFTSILNPSLLTRPFRSSTYDWACVGWGRVYRLTVVVFFFYPATIMGPVAFCCWQMFCLYVFKKERHVNEKNKENAIAAQRVKPPIPTRATDVVIAEAEQNGIQKREEEEEEKKQK